MKPESEGRRMNKKKKKDRPLKKGDSVFHKDSPTLRGSMVGRYGNIIHVIFPGLTAPGKYGRVPEKDLVRIP